MPECPDWLTQALEQMTYAQRAQFTLAAEAYAQQPHIAARGTDDPGEHQADDDAAHLAILQHILQQGSLAGAAAEVRDADHALTGWIRGMHALGMSETRIAEGARLARATVRRRLGKQRRSA